MKIPLTSIPNKTLSKQAKRNYNALKKIEGYRVPIKNVLCDIMYLTPKSKQDDQTSRTIKKHIQKTITP